jgi:hypothetical protein
MIESATDQQINLWGLSLDKLKEWDPKGAELLLRVGTSPWTSGSAAQGGGVDLPCVRLFLHDFG